MYSGRDEKNNLDPRWRWRDWHEATRENPSVQYICDSTAKPLNEDYAFMTKDLKIRHHPYLWYYGQPVGNWLDFDASIIINR